MKVFVDIGAHFGESIVEVLKPTHGFDKVICIEPSHLAFIKLSKFSDSRLQIERWGAWDQNSSSVLYSAGAIGASLYVDKPNKKDTREEIELRDIREFFDSLFREDDDVYLKINAEGSEYVILNRLLGEHSTKWKIRSILLSLDILKVPSLKHHAPDVLKLLGTRKVEYEFRRDPDPATAIKLWLAQGNSSRHSFEVIKWVRYFLAVPKWFHLRVTAKKIVPRKLWIKIALRWGPNRIQN